MDYCAYCYKESNEKEQVTFSRCGKCNKRCFCSRDCQILDWKTGHKLYCGLAGEDGIDFEVRPTTDGKGLGVFAIRDFQEDEIIMMERPILMNPYDFNWDSVPLSARSKVESLAPLDGTLMVQVLRNSISCGDDSSGIFLTMSKVNHDCLGNSCHLYLENRLVKILVATRAISKGEEILFSYSHKCSFERKGILLDFYKFRCACKVCSDPTVENDLDLMIRLDEEILILGSVGSVEVAIRKGRRLLELKRKYKTGSWWEFRTFYDLFQLAVTKRSTLRDAKQFIQKAYDSALRFTRDPEYSTVQQAKQLICAPESHRNYLILS